MSNIDTALRIVDKFQATTPQEGVAWILDRDQTLNRLRAILRQPELIHQRALNACGPAVFFRTWFSRDPVAAANFSCTLLRDGSAQIGSLTVNAGWKLLGQNYSKLRSYTDGLKPGSTPETADWMLLSALRQSENLWWDYAGEPNTAADYAAGITLPGTVTGWLNATNVYSNVNDGTSLVLPSDKSVLLNLQTPPHLDVILLVDSSVTSLYLTPIADIPDRGWVPIPNHYIAMLSPITLQPEDSRWLHIDIWTWGSNRSGWQGSEKLLNNYFGAIVATVKG
ncbi:hypothetical protein [Nitrosomonas sp. Nm58]|uniref:hypothetical protein n=1 Tax=Nitrosomonas sp. Nm58 TaxID=200126 RepID=UPI00089A504C|nr:hypothetical protein [Nitrosomonas sp. Nm58]SDY88716.1 hypothetical protein SAMN05421754_10288 [Nitrosomonas sp. Nm58]